MIDFDSRLEQLNATRAPDLWQEIEARAPGPEVSTTRRHRMLATAIALIVAASGIGVGVWAFTRPGHRTPAAPPAPQTGELWARVGGGDGPSFVDRIDVQTGGIVTLFNDGRAGPDGPGVDLFEAVGDDYSWSPAGDALVFSKGFVPDGSSTAVWELFTMSPDGSNIRRVTFDGAYNGQPAWSPDGSTIAFTSWRGTAPEAGCLGTQLCPGDIYLLHVATGEETRLTSVPADDSQPSWSRDGQTIAFVSRRVDPNGDIFAMDAEGSNVRALTHGPEWDSWPKFSPKTDMLAFVRFEHPTTRLWLMNAEGSDQHSPVDVSVDSFAWAPDGGSIAIASLPDQGKQETTVWLIDPDGSNLREVGRVYDLGVGGMAWGSGRS